MNLLRSTLGATALCLGALALAPAWAQQVPAAPPAYEPKEGQAGKDVIWLPTAQSLVDRMLEMARLTPRDHLIDLGSGDGRLVITAARRGATAHGIEYNPDLVTLSQRAARAEGVATRATFEKADIFESDFSKATVITMFLLPELNLQLRPKLLEMKPGTRIVSNSFDMGDWQPDQTQQVTENCRTYCEAYQWTVPAKVAGTWRLADGRELVLQQNFQMLEGQLAQAGERVAIRDARVDGTRIRFTAGADRYVGELSGGRLQGSVNEGARTWRAVTP